jgi:hypothetical protein
MSTLYMIIIMIWIIIIHDIHVLCLLYIDFMYIYIQILPYLYMTTFCKPLTDKQLGCRHIGG